MTCPRMLRSSIFISHFLATPPTGSRDHLDVGDHYKSLRVCLHATSHLDPSTRSHLLNRHCSIKRQNDTTVSPAQHMFCDLVTLYYVVACNHSPTRSADNLFILRESKTCCLTHSFSCVISLA